MGIRGNSKDHAAIITAIKSSPHKCIDKQIAAQFNCSYRTVIKLRYDHTDIMFHKKKDKPMPVHPTTVETKRINYLQELRNMPYNVARILLAMKGYFLSLNQVKEWGDG